MGDPRVGVPADPRTSVGIVIDAGEKTLDLVAPAGININGTPLSGAYDLIDPDYLTVGEASMHRRLVNSSGVASGTGTLRLAHFTARKSETITQVRIYTGTTAAAATPTLCRIGLYTVAANGDIALVASTPNDTTLFAAPTTAYTKAFSVAYAKVAGQRYAVGALIVTGAAAPNFYGNATWASQSAELGIDPKIASAQGSLADLPASTLSASVGVTGQFPYVVLLP